MERVQVRFAAVLFLAVFSASALRAEEHGGGLSGTVRDARGVPQMGAVVQLIGTGRGDVRTAVTGLDGRYLFDHLLTGTYRLRASASLFRPVSTQGMRVGAGVQAVVNLTLANVYSAGVLLPVERRQPDEANDDWMWTMRSAASRPVLRLAGGAPARQAEDGASMRPSMPVSVGLGAGSGGFGAGGAEQEVAAGFQSADETRAATGVARMGGKGARLALQIAGERRSSPWSSLSGSVAFESDPAITRVGSGAGWKAMRMASAEAIHFGDMAAVEAGSMLVSDASQTGIPVSRPFGRVRVTLPGSWTLEYAVATDRSLQSAADAGGTATAAMHGMGVRQGTSRIEHGRHQTIFVSRQSRTRMLAVGFYRDGLEQTPLQGGASTAALPGLLHELGLTGGALVDSSTGMFRAEGRGYTADGCHIAASQQIAPNTWVEFRVANGAALELPVAGASGEKVSVPQVRVAHGIATGVSAHTRVRRTGTAVRASYQWQAERIITPIDAFDAVDLSAYLGFIVQQDVPARVAPRGTVVRVSASNVLRQGVRNVVAGDQSVATVAQELPTLQAGIRFTF